MVEPWLRGTLTEFDALRRQVLHALELAAEDLERWCSELDEVQMQARPHGIAPVGFHLRHIGRSLDRLLTYAEGGALSEGQLRALAREMEATIDPLEECLALIAEAMERVKRFSPESYEQVRFVGRQRLPTTVGGLLIHCAEHTQRHVGQAITTARLGYPQGGYLSPKVFKPDTLGPDFGPK